MVAVLRVPSTRSEEDLVVELLERDGVLVHPGFFFDFPHEAFLVVSLLPTRRDVCTTACAACWSASMTERGARRFGSGRHAGVLVPLFSIPSRRSWGVGEIPDLVPLSRWLERAGFDFVQFLPLNEMQEGQSSPYSALSAMALDPLFIALDDARRVDGGGREHAATPRIARRSTACARRRAVDYAAVRALKSRALRHVVHVVSRAISGAPAIAAIARLRAFEERERWWLDDYALFRALHDEHGGRHWREWEPGSAIAIRGALAAARARLERRVRYYAYLQWIADEQWQRARMEAAPVGVFGDFPFMVSGHSADVWARQDEFDLDSSVGTPPDAFSATGQDWGLPAYRWDVVAAGDYAWLRASRAPRGRALRWLPHRSPDRLLPHVRPQQQRRRRLRSGRRSRAAGAGRAAAHALQRIGRQPHRRGSRNRPRLPARVPGASAAFRG